MPRLTKKQLKILNKAELRKLAISGMNLEIARAYGATEGFLIDFIYGDVDTFLDVKVTDINTSPTTGKPYFREGITEYVTQLQSYIKGTQSEAPAWPPNPVSEEPLEETTVEEPTEEEEEVTTPSTARRTIRRNPRRIATKSTAKTQAKPETTEKAEEPAAEEKFEEVKAAEPIETEKPVEAPQAVDLTPVLELITGLKASVDAYSEKLDAVSKDIESIKRYAAAGKKSHKQVGNGLLWLANNLTIQEDEALFAEVTDFPPPSEYIEAGDE